MPSSCLLEPLKETHFNLSLNITFNRPYPNNPLSRPGFDDNFFSASATMARAFCSLSAMAVHCAVWNLNTLNDPGSDDDTDNGHYGPLVTLIPASWNHIWGVFEAQEWDSRPSWMVSLDLSSKCRLMQISAAEEITSLSDVEVVNTIAQYDAM